jgi:hypothetical protein
VRTADGAVHDDDGATVDQALTTSPYVTDLLLDCAVECLLISDELPAVVAAA